MSLNRQQLSLVAIVVAQAAWLGLIMLRGWYSGPDLGNLASATGRPLNWSYLTASVGGHLGILGRLFWWGLERTAPLNWTLTVLLRLVFQSAATVLLDRLLVTLVGRRTWISVVVGLYAFSPLLVPGTAVLSSGFGLSLGQVCLLAALLSHLRYARQGRLRDAFKTGVLVLAMVMVADIALVAVIALPLLSIGFLHEGSLRERLAASIKRWPGWLFLAIGGAVYVALYADGEYSPQQRAFGLSDAAVIAEHGLVRVLGPALLGGPWRVAEFPNEYSGLLDPPLVLQVLGQVALVLLVGITVRRAGLRALLALSLPIGVLIAGLLLAALGRFVLTGTSLPDVPRYSYYLPVMMAIGLTLAFARDPAASPLAQSRFGLAMPWAVGAIMLASLVSSGEFAHAFWRNPAHHYVDTLTSSAREVGLSRFVYDTAVPPGVVPFLAPRHYVSDVLGLSRVSVRLQGEGSNALVASEEGRLVAAGFFVVANNSGTRGKGCGTFIGGATTTTLTFPPVPTEREWFLQLQLYQPHANRANIEVRDAHGGLLKITSGETSLRSAGSLVVENRRLHLGVPSSVTLRTTDPHTSFCLVHAFIGVPLPK